jgi:hypothetical protein
MSMTCVTAEPGDKPVRFPSQQATQSMLRESITLTAINEEVTGDHHQGRKLLQILKCHTDGNVDNAVESDHEDVIEGIPAHLGHIVQRHEAERGLCHIGNASIPRTV